MPSRDLGWCISMSCRESNLAGAYVCSLGFLLMIQYSTLPHCKLSVASKHQLLLDGIFSFHSWRDHMQTVGKTRINLHLPAYWPSVINDSNWEQCWMVRTWTYKLGGIVTLTQHRLLDFILHLSTKLTPAMLLLHTNPPFLNESYGSRPPYQYDNAPVN